MAVDLQTRKRKRVSKKKKNSWRKHIDHSDVEQFLDNKRLQERIGGSFNKWDDNELFEIDTNQNKRKNFRVNLKDIKLRCLEGLKNTSAVPDPVKKRNRVKTKEERQHPILKKKKEQLLKRGILKRKERVKLEKLFSRRVGRFKQKPKWRVEINRDAWKDTSGKKSSKYRPPKNKEIDSFEVPHPGVSYNPALEDYTDLVDEVAQKELATEKKEKHLQRVTSNIFSRVTPAQREEIWREEMSQGIPLIDKAAEKNNLDDGEEIDNNTEYTAINPPVTREKKKTRTQKNKQLRLKKEQIEKDKVKMERKKLLDLQRLKRITAEVDEEQEQAQKKKLKRLQRREKKLREPGRVCKHKFNPCDEASFTLAGELCGSLREMIPVGNVLKDRFLNMQKRNLIEVMKPQFKKRKTKTKKYTVADHRITPIELPASEVFKKKVSKPNHK